MDGGGRLLRSVNSSTTALRGREAAYLPSGHNIARQNAHFVDFPMAPQKHGHRKSGFFRRLERLAAHWQNGLGLLFSLVLIGTAGLYGVIRNGQYEAFIAANGSVQDILAHAVGFGISSITITSQNGVPETTILKAAGIIPGEKVHVLNENTGHRLETYVIAGNPASGVICLNGPAARHGFVGDRLIILSYGLVEAAEAKGLAPKIVYLDSKNKIKKF